MFVRLCPYVGIWSGGGREETAGLKLRLRAARNFLDHSQRQCNCAVAGQERGAVVEPGEHLVGIEVLGERRNLPCGKVGLPCGLPAEGGETRAGGSEGEFDRHASNPAAIAR